MKDSGFTLIEVLIAAVLLAVLIGSLVSINLHLAQTNARAEVQTVEAATAEAAITQYRNRLPAVGGSVSGSAANVLSSDSLSSTQQALLKVLSFTIARTNGSTLVVTVQRNDIEDHNPLILQID